MLIILINNYVIVDDVEPAVSADEPEADVDEVLPPSREEDLPRPEEPESTASSDEREVEIWDQL